MKRYIAVAVVVVGVAFGSRAALQAIARRQVRDEQRGHVERAMLYEVSKSWQPTFEITSAQRLLKISASAQMPPQHDRTTIATWGYDIVLRTGTTVLWQRHIHFESRQSRSQPDADGLMRRAVAAFDGREFSDLREAWINLPRAPANASLQIRLTADSAPPGVTGIRVFVAEPRDQEGRQQAAAELAPLALDRMMQRTGQLAGAFVSPAQLDTSLRTRWRRIPALGDHDADYQTIRVTLSEYRTNPPTSIVPVEAITVDRYHWAAINLTGPGMLRLQPHAIASPAADDTAHAATPENLPGAPEPEPESEPVPEPAPALQFEWRAALADGTSTPSAHSATAGASASTSPPPHSLQLSAGNLSIPSGVGTLVIRSDATTTQGFTLEGVPAMQFDGLLDATFEPNAQKIPIERIDAEHRVEIPVLAAANPRSIVGRVARLDARIVLDDAATVGVDTDVNAILTVTFMDRNGKAIMQRTVPVISRRSLFETNVTPDGVRDVTEPVSFRIVAPITATHYTVHANRSVAVRLSRFIGQEDRLREPFFSHPSASFVWRYANRDLRIWQPFMSQQHAALLAAGHVDTLIAQPRLEVLGDGALDLNNLGDGATSQANAALLTLLPVGSPEQQRIREPVRDDALAHTLKTWPAGSVTRIQPGTPREFIFSAQAQGRPRLSLRTNAAALGQPLTITVDNQPWLATTLTTLGDTLDLPVTTAGKHTVAVSAPPGTSVWLDRPPTPDQRGNALGVAKLRYVYPLSSTPVRVRAVRKTGTSVRVYAIVYAPKPEADPNVKLRITISGGNPARSPGAVVKHLTLGDRIVTLPAATSDSTQPIFVDLDGKRVGYARVISLGLLDDLQIGSHEVDVYAPPSANLWVRFVATASAVTTGTEPGAIVWRRNLSPALDSE